MVDSNRAHIVDEEGRVEERSAGEVHPGLECVGRVAEGDDPCWGYTFRVYPQDSLTRVAHQWVRALLHGWPSQRKRRIQFRLRQGPEELPT